MGPARAPILARFRDTFIVRIGYSTDLEALYPMWSEFQRVRQKLDPQGRFLNPHVRDLLL